MPRRHRRREEQPAASPAASRRQALTIPAGIRPDRAEVVEWLLEQAGVTIIVDGYNLLFHLEPGALFVTGEDVTNRAVEHRVVRRTNPRNSPPENGGSTA